MYLTTFRRCSAAIAIAYTLATMLSLQPSGSRSHAGRAIAETSPRIAVDSAPVMQHYTVPAMTIVGTVAAVPAASDRVKSAGPQMHCGPRRPLDSDASAMVRVCTVY